jgi:hypothetical protein
VDECKPLCQGPRLRGSCRGGQVTAIHSASGREVHENKHSTSIESTSNWRGLVFTDRAWVNAHTMALWSVGHHEQVRATV